MAAMLPLRSGAVMEELGLAISAYTAMRGAAAAAAAAPAPEAEKRTAAQPSQPTKASPSTSPSASPSASPADGKLRVLCLHGYVQNGEVFRQKTGSVRKVMKGCEFEFIDAPHSAVGAFPDSAAADFDAAGVATEGVGPRGWWHAGENAKREAGQEWVRPAMAQVCDGWEASLEHARSEIAALGRFDGVFAFSQGCAVATALLREAREGGFEPLADARFAILVGGFLPREEKVASMMRGSGAPLALHTLHVTGTADTFVPRPRSEELAELFDGGRGAWLEHQGRHGVPTGTGAFRDALRKLLGDVR